MKPLTLILIAAIAAQAYAGHKHGSPIIEPIPLPVPIVAVPAQIALPVSPPSIIDESDRSKSCPPGFLPIGKQCVKTITVPPNAFCPPGSIRSGDHYGEESCARYVAKLFECPGGYERVDGQCVQTQQVEPDLVCPEGFVLDADGRRCVRSVPLPPVFICPPGTVQKGDNCVTRSSIPPQLVCPPGFSQEGKRCRIEETYDCTPIREPSVAKEQLPFAPFVSGHKKHLRLLGAKHGGEFGGFGPYVPIAPILGPVPGKGIAPTKEEYVLSKTCKRVRTEAARKICPSGGSLEGKLCIVEELQPLLQKAGGFHEEFIPSEFICPEGYFPSSPIGRFNCLITHEVPVNAFCPPGTQDLGNRCATYQPLVFNCPPEYVLDSGACAKTLFAQPTVEFTVTYACKGKDCDHGYPAGKHHKK